MPVLAAIVGAVMTGLLYWFRFGDGMETIDGWLRNERDRKRREAALERQRTAPLRDIKDPREAAVALMALVGEARGVLTPEQIGVINAAMAEALEFGRDLEERLAFARHAAAQAATIEEAVGVLAPVLRGALTAAEREELRAMLERVAALHGGATAEQEAAVALIMRRIAGPA